MVHASLFTGIGGFDLAAEWCGWENSFQCEINDFCQLVLAKNFPHADRHTDIKGFDAHAYGAIEQTRGPFGVGEREPANSPARQGWRLTEPPLCRGNDGLPAGLVRVSTRAKQLKAYGNSIVPQVAYEIFQAIKQVEA